jgi:hypothetical protein
VAAYNGSGRKWGRRVSSSLDYGMQALFDFWSKAGAAALDWQQGASANLANMAGGMPGFPSSTPEAGSPDLAQAARAVAELWSTAATMSGTMHSLLTTGKAADEPTVEATFRAIADPRVWFSQAGGLDSVISQMTEGAQFADMWRAEREQAQLTKSWLEWRRRSLEHQAVMLEAWVRAGNAFNLALAERVRTAGMPPTGRALLDLWTSSATGVLLETQRSENFLKSQAAMLRAGSELRLAQRSFAERLAAQFDMPTRTEMNDLLRTVTELRRELRTVRRHTEEQAL